MNSDNIEDICWDILDIYFQKIKIKTNNLSFDDKFNLYQFYLFKDI